VRYNKGIVRFSLCGRPTVDGQLMLLWLVHNIDKLANNGYAA